MNTIIGIIIFIIWIYFIVIYFINKKNGWDIAVGITAIFLLTIVMIGFSNEAYDYKQKFYACQYKEMKSNFNLFNK